MTEEEKKKQEQQTAIARQQFAPVSPITPSTSTQRSSAQDGDLGYGSIYDRLTQRRDEAAMAAEGARRRWRQVYDETGDVMAGFIPRPKDTSNEQNKLRRVAIAQALGELVGTIGQGIIASGRGGEGYVTAPLGMYNNTVQQLQKLKDQGLSDQKDYATMMSRLRMQQAQGRVDAAKEEVDRYDQERMAYDKIIADYERRLREKEIDAEKAQKEREFRASENEKNRENRIKAAQIRAASSDRKSQEKKYASEYLHVLAPRGITTTRTDADGIQTTTVRDDIPKSTVDAWMGYSASLKRLGVSLVDIQKVQDALGEGLKDQLGQWQWIVGAYESGATTDEIVEEINQYKQ